MCTLFLQKRGTRAYATRKVFPDYCPRNDFSPQEKLSDQVDRGFERKGPAGAGFVRGKKRNSRENGEDEPSFFEG
jgi:hypothetical protein